MNNWFECKVKYDKTSEEGLIKTVTEAYLVDALSFTEAEARINTEMKPYISGDWLVANIKRVKIAEMFDNKNPVADKWYRSKVNLIGFDEDKNVEKRLPNTMYIKASDIKEALENLLEGMKGSLADFEVASIVETTVMDVYHQELIIKEEEDKD